MRHGLYLPTAALAGLLFGAGLYVSQMVDPLKILRFLDFGAIATGGWDPSVAFVMAGGLAVMLAAMRLSGRRAAPLFDTRFHGATFTGIDAPLVLGSVLFGIGWGMSGICPGPAIALIAFLPDNLWIFLLAMLAGSWLGSFVMRGRVAQAAAAA